MADWQLLARRLFGQQEPVAQARITRTPIYTDSSKLPSGASGLYDKGAIYISPTELQQGPDWTVPHEEAHAIYDQAGLRRVGAALASRVGEGPRNRILATPLYNTQDQAGNNEQMSDEGLGFSIGDSEQIPYVNYAASRIQDPRMKQQLLRLNRNALATRALGGMSKLMD